MKGTIRLGLLVGGMSFALLAGCSGDVKYKDSGSNKDQGPDQKLPADMSPGAEAGSQDQGKADNGLLADTWSGADLRQDQRRPDKGSPDLLPPDQTVAQMDLPAPDVTTLKPDLPGPDQHLVLPDTRPMPDTLTWPDTRPVLDQYVLQPDMVAWPDTRPWPDQYVVLPDTRPTPDTLPWPDTRPWPDQALPDMAAPDAATPDFALPDIAYLADQGTDGAGLPDGGGATVPGTWLTIPAGTFTMGSPTSEACRNSTRETEHQVTLTRSYQMLSTPVTQAMFASVMGYNPSLFSSCGTNCPVENVNWHEAAAYCNQLSSNAGKTPCYTCTNSGTTSVSCTEAAAYTGQSIYSCPGYRLPTDAEWEYAYRAGTQTAFYNGGISSCSGADANADKIAWYYYNSGSKTNPVGQKDANTLGLKDMAGSVWEWCNDWVVDDLGGTSATDPYGAASGTTKVGRGGGFASLPDALRGAYRAVLGPNNRGNTNGFRPVRTLDLALTDETFADFSQGTPSESGAKLYVSAQGNVQALDRMDLNLDGYADIVFSNSNNGSSTQINSYIYWGTSSGLTTTGKKELPTVGASGCATADLNDDGYADVIFANANDGSSYYKNSYIYWGSASGYSVTARSGLPTIGANSLSVADLNSDGYLDLIFSNGGDGTSGKVNSYIYWGQATGFSTASRTELPTDGTENNTVADLDKDGKLDIVFANYSNGAGSYIYWGKAPAYTSSNMTTLATPATAYEVAAADLNSDGYLDLGFGIQFGLGGSGITHNVNSLIYWGSATGFSTAPQELPTSGAVGVSFAHLNSDGYLDVVFSNFYDDSSNNINSYIYWGATAGFSAASRAEYPTTGAWGNLVADFDGDGHQEVSFSPYKASSNYSLNALVYGGSAAGPVNTTATPLPVYAAMHATSSDPGSVYSRRPLYSYTSRVHDTSLTSPTYATLLWEAKVPQKTVLKFQIRSAATSGGLSSATWYGPTSTTDYYTAPTSTSPAPTVNSSGSFTLNSVHSGHRYIQYQAIFEQGYDFTNTPVLDKVSILYQ